MAIRTVLGALRAGALGIIGAAAGPDATRDTLYQAVRAAFPKVHWTRARQLVGRWERDQIAAVAGVAKYGTRLEPGMFVANRYYVRVKWFDPSSGDDKSIVVKLDSDRALQLAELEERAAAIASIFEELGSPGAEGLSAGPPGEVEFEQIIHLERP